MERNGWRGSRGSKRSRERGRGRGRGGRGGRGGSEYVYQEKNNHQQEPKQVVLTHCGCSIVDIGLNLTSRQFANDTEAVVQRAKSVGVDTLILTGTNISGSKKALKLCEKINSKPLNSQNFSQMYFTAGIHPHDAKTCNSQTIDELKTLALHPQMVAIGECGLDFDRNFSPQEIQKKWFEEQLKLAVELNKPIFLHERCAHSSFITILSKYRSQLIKGGVVHCFTGTAQELNDYIELDMYIGITGWITDPRRGKHLQSIVKDIPLNRLLIETDAPFLTPFNIINNNTNNNNNEEQQQPKKRSYSRKRNEPAYLPYVLKCVAECIGLSEEQVAQQTTENAKQLFGF